MVRKGATGRDQGRSAFPREAYVEQAIPVKVRKFTAVPYKAEAAKAVSAWHDAGKLEGVGFEGLQRRHALAVKQRGPRQEERVEEMRDERHSRQPAQAADDELEDHGWISARRLMFRITRICTAWNMRCVHQSKYHAGRTCKAYQVRPMSVVVPSPLS